MRKSNLYGAHSNYEQIKSALQRQTAALLAERTHINSTFQHSNIQPSIQRPQSTSLTPVVHHSSNKQSNTSQVVRKLQQIIQLCKQEGTLSQQQMRQVVKVESQVLNYLQKTTAQPQLDVVRPISSSEQELKSRVEAAPSFPSVNQTWGKQATNRQLLSEDTLQIIGQIQRKALGEIVLLQQQKDAIKKQKEHIAAEYQKLQQMFYARVPENNESVDLKGLRDENRKLKVLSEQTQRLKQQNKILRQQNQYLNSRVDAIGNASTINGRQTSKLVHRDSQQNIGFIQGQYSSQIAVYQNQLKRASVVINQLRSKLANVPGLQQLHDQGERIRRDTTQLLRIKNSPSGHLPHDQLIRDLQERLDNQERGKTVFLEELKLFKQRYIQLEEENKMLRKSKVSFDTIPKGGSTPRPQRQVTSPRTGIMKKKNSYLGEYQQTLQDLKQVLY